MQFKLNIDKNILYNLYIIEKLSLKEIASKMNISQTSLKKYFNIFNIKIQSRGAKNTTTETMRNEIVSLYKEERKTIDFIAKKLCISKDIVYRCLKFKNIKIMNYRHHKHDYLTKKMLENLYINQNLSSTEIAKLYNIQQCIVGRKLKKFNIKLKNRSLYKVLKGKEHPRWTGMTSVAQSIRMCKKYNLWRKNIFTRDNYLCVFCNSGGKLQADHIKKFSTILKENNIKTLEESFLCDELWDHNNGRTLCVECHQKTDTYGFKGIKDAI